MNTPDLQHDVFVLERRYAKPPERVFQAFADPEQKRRWYAEHPSSELLDYELDFREGGIERASMRLNAGPLAGTPMVAHNVHLRILPGQAIVAASTMDVGDRRISASLLTFAFEADGAAGTRLVFTHQAVFFAGADGPAMRREGWEKLLDRFGEVLG